MDCRGPGNDQEESQKAQGSITCSGSSPGHIKLLWTSWLSSWPLPGPSGSASNLLDAF